MRIKFYFSHLLILLFLVNVPAVFVNAQSEALIANANINGDCNGYWEYLPAGYNPAGSTTYPLLIYISGIAEFGNGNTDLSKLTDDIPNGVPYWVHNGTNLSSWTVNGTSYKFIMVAPQWINRISDPTKYPTIDEINSFINYIIEHYKIDRSRIYLMGISTGAGSVWHYARTGSTYANRLAAIIPFSGTDTPTHARAQVLVDRKMPIWAFHNSADAGVPVHYTIGWQDSINYLGSYSPTPKFTIFNTTGDPGNHVSWASGTQGTYTEGGLNVYQWMLQYSQTPPANQPPVANAGPNRSIVSPNNSVQLQGSATDFDSYTLAYSWSRVSGPNNPTISNGNTTSPTISGLVAGNYVFRLTATDLTSLSGTSDVNVTVLPAGSLTKIEAENFSAQNGGTIYSDASTSGGSYVGNLSPGNWLDFPINTLGGNFNFSFRVGTQYGASFSISVGGNTPFTVNVPNINSTYGWRTVAISNFNIPAGAQTLRLTINTGSYGPDMDYFSFQSVSQGPLPIRFVYFNSKCQGGGVNLEWKTAQEVNSRNFEIQKSIDGASWNSMASIAASGQSSVEKTYQYRDNTTSGATAFYRIVENDLDGRSQISSIVRSSCFSKTELSISPNPSSGNATLNINLEQSTKVVLLIVDSKGALMKQSEIMLPAGNSTVPLTISNFAEGVYSINVRYNNEMKTLKLIKK